MTKTTPSLSDSSVILKAIVESAHMGYWDWYFQNDYVFMSPGFKSMFGYSDSEISNSSAWWKENIHSEDLPGVMTVFEEHIQSKGKVPYDNEVRYFHKDGSVVWVYCRGEVIEWSDDGQPLRMVGSHIDITELKQTQESLEKAKEDYRKKAEELSQFNKDMVGRELRMIDLKEEVNELLIANGQDKKYTIYK